MSCRGWLESFGVYEGVPFYYLHLKLIVGTPRISTEPPSGDSRRNICAPEARARRDRKIRMYLIWAKKLRKLYFCPCVRARSCTPACKKAHTPIRWKASGAILERMYISKMNSNFPPAFSPRSDPISLHPCGHRGCRYTGTGTQ